MLNRECEVCGIKFVDFRNTGRLGCPHDYQEFRDELMPLLENIHGETRHCGKTPRRLPQNKQTQAELIAAAQATAAGGQQGSLRGGRPAPRPHPPAGRELTQPRAVRPGPMPTTGRDGGVKCQFCSNPATVHLTDIVENQKKELHLCQACAEAQHLVKQQELNLPAILQTLIGQHLGPQTDELARLTCPACGIKYMEFRAAGPARLPARLRRLPRRPGTAAAAHPPVDPPRRQVAAPHGVRRRPRRPNWSSLRRQLQAAVEAEAYEEAARFRDLLRKKEATDESG